jgi:hypothetical protein
MEPQYQSQQHQSNPMATLNKAWIINGGAALLLAAVGWFVLRPDQRPVERTQQQVKQQQTVSPTLSPSPMPQAQPPQPVQPIQQPTLIQQQQPVATYEAMQISQPQPLPQTTAQQYVAAMSPEVRASWDNYCAVNVLGLQSLQPEHQDYCRVILGQ